MLSRRFAVQLILAALVLGSWNSSGFASSSWGIQPVGSSGFEQGHNATSLALDSQGRPHVAFYEGVGRDLRFSEKNQGNWTTTIVDTLGDTGRWASLAIDAQGNPHISYYYFLNPSDVPTGDLKYARRSGGVWTIETVASTGNVGEYTSLALDSQGNPHISYYDNDLGDLRYARKSGGTWSFETVESAGYVGIYTSLALTDLNEPRIAYQDVTGFRVRFASKSGTTWTLETPSGIVPVVPVHISLALDSQDRPHIAYYDQNVDKTKYASKTSTTWSHGIASALGAELRGSFTSLKLDAQDVPHMSYFATSTGLVTYAVKNGSGGTYWVAQSVDGQGPWTSLVLDAGDHPHISYYLSTGSQVRYAVFTDNVSDTSQEGRVAFLSLEAFPNPVRTSTTLLLRSPRSIPLHLMVIDARGRIVRDLANRQLPPGTHAFGWDGRDDAGQLVAAGVYFAVARPDWLATARKLVVVR